MNKLKNKSRIFPSILQVSIAKALIFRYCNISTTGLFQTDNRYKMHIIVYLLYLHEKRSVAEISKEIEHSAILTFVV